MQLPSVALVLALSAFAVAVPASSTNGIEIANTSEVTITTLIERSPVFHLITFCEHPFRRGKCYTAQMRTKTCYNFDSWWNYRVSSMYAPPGSWCTFYSNYMCKGSPFMWNSPSVPDLGINGGRMNNKASSINCG